MRSIVQNFVYILKSYKTSSVLNILGLSAALAVFIITMIQVDYDFSFNRNIRNSKDIYLFSSFWREYDKRITNISYPIMRELSNDYPEIKSFCLLQNHAEKEFIISDEPEAPSFKITKIEATSGLLEIFTPEILSGEVSQVFMEPGKAMITEDIAMMLFGKEDPVGKSIFLKEEEENPLTIVGICKKFPDNVSLFNGIYTYLPEDTHWGSYNYKGYLMADKKDIPSLQKKLNEDFLKKLNNTEKIELIPLRDIHFAIPEEKGGNLSAALSLLAMGVVILLIAFINYMNFSIAMIPTRLRSLNIQKITGADPRRLKVIIASEASIFCLLSFFIAIFFVYLFGKVNLSNYFSADLAVFENLNILSITFFSGMIISFILGLYPASSLSAFPPAMVINHSFSHSKKNVTLRNILIVIQFFAAIVLIVVSAFIKIQHNYMTRHSWGLQKENILYIKLGSEDVKPATLFNELKKNPDVLDYTVSDALPGYIYQGWGRTVGDKQNVWFTAWLVQNNFLDFFGIDIVEGRDFLESDNGKSYIICNESFANEYDFPGGVIGQKMEGHETGIIGVMKDVNFASLHNEIKPLCIITESLNWDKYFLLKISGDNTPETIGYIKKVIHQLSGKPMDVSFLEESLDRLYVKEENLAKLISILGIIAIAIAVMGVYGLILFNTKLKEKEIAVRKINGSAIGEIILLLNRSVIIQLGVAFCCSVPVAYFIVIKWLEDFAYKTPVHWWVFLAAGLLILFITLLTISCQSYKAANENPSEVLKNE